MAASERVFHMFGAIAPFERGRIAKRTKDGIAAARQLGLGRSPVSREVSRAGVQRSPERSRS